MSRTTHAGFVLALLEQALYDRRSAKCKGRMKFGSSKFCVDHRGVFRFSRFALGVTEDPTA